jgi:2,5-furandicarboxylate decarboxylase 1
MNEIHDLRTFITAIDAAGQLARIGRPVSLLHELADVAAALERSGGPAPLFTALQPGRQAAFDWQIFSSGLANQARVAIALGCAPEDVTAAMGRALDPAAALGPRLAPSAAWQANSLTGDAIDIRRLPIPIHAANDGGPFITAGVIVSQQPGGDRANLSYNRMQVLGPRTFGCNINEWRDLRRFLNTAEAAGQALPCAVAIGLDPAIMIAAGCKYDGDELCIAGAIRGQPVAVTRGLTIPTLIPADAEIVIEGHLLAGARADEGPLAEFHGYYGELWNSPVFEVSAINYRDQPIFQTTIPGWTEHIYIGNVLPREPLLLRFVRHASPNVRALHIPPYGNGFMAIVQIDKRNPGEPRNVAMAAFTAHVNIRVCMVVDADVNLHDPADVLWALVSRVDWGRDVFMVPGAQGHEMDPANDARGIGTKLGIDATMDKGRRDYGDRVRYHPVDLTQYLGH